jgi:hypothetical protein
MHHCINLSPGVYKATIRDTTTRALLLCKYFWSIQCFALNLCAVNVSFQRTNGSFLHISYVVNCRSATPPKPLPQNKQTPWL